MSEGTDQQIKDFVCGMVKPISQMKAQSVYNGKTYYFCTEEDRKMFEAYPDRWLPEGERNSIKNEQN